MCLCASVYFPQQMLFSIMKFLLTDCKTCNYKGALLTFSGALKEPVPVIQKLPKLMVRYTTVYSLIAISVLVMHM